MSDATHHQFAAVAACTVEASHRRDHHHGDDGACHPHLVEVVHLGRRAVAVLPRLLPRLRLPPRARGGPPGGRPPPRDRRLRVLRLRLLGGVSRRPRCDQPHHAQVGHAAALHGRRNLADTWFGENQPGGSLVLLAGLRDHRVARAGQVATWIAQVETVRPLAIDLQRGGLPLDVFIEVREVSLSVRDLGFQHRLPSQVAGPDQLRDLRTKRVQRPALLGRIRVGLRCWRGRHPPPRRRS